MKYKIIATIEKGMSKDAKHIIEVNGKRFLLRKIAYSRKKLNHYKLLLLVKKENINISKLQYLYHDNQYIYAFFDYIDGVVLENCINVLNVKTVYNYGVQAGYILKQIHNNKILNNTLKYEFSNTKCVNMVINNYEKLDTKTQKTDIIFNMILNAANSINIKFDDYCYLNADYHYGNFIVNKDRLFLIDLEKHEVGNRYRDFTFIYTYNEDRTFAFGKINGYFDNNISDDFWIQFKFFSALYILQYYMWEYKHTGNHNNAIHIIDKFLDDYDNNNLVPKWYIKEKIKCKEMDI